MEQGIEYSSTAVCGRKYNLRFMMNKSGFSPEEDEILLEKIKKYGILFDSKNKNYKNMESKNDIWKDISRDLGKTVDETKKRWKNIRDSYFRNKRKLGTRSAAAKKTKWHLKSHLSFLDTVVHERRVEIKNNFTRGVFIITKVFVYTYLLWYTLAFYESIPKGFYIL